MWQHVKLSEQIRPWDTLACCWDVKQPTNKLPQPPRQPFLALTLCRQASLAGSPPQYQGTHDSTDLEDVVVDTISRLWASLNNPVLQIDGLGNRQRDFTGREWRTGHRVVEGGGGGRGGGYGGWGLRLSGWGQRWSRKEERTEIENALLQGHGFQDDDEEDDDDDDED